MTIFGEFGCHPGEQLVDDWQLLVADLRSFDDWLGHRLDFELIKFLKLEFVKFGFLLESLYLLLKT